jgi:putative redox protein
MRVIARRRRGYTHEVEIEGGHTLVIDEPTELGGNDEGPTPSRAIAAALAACTAITCEMYAARKGWELGDVEVSVEVEYGPNQSMVRSEVTLCVPEPLDPEQQRRLLVIAGKCPVHRALAGETPIEISDRIECPPPEG